MKCRHAGPRLGSQPVAQPEHSLQRPGRLHGQTPQDSSTAKSHIVRLAARKWKRSARHRSHQGLPVFAAICQPAPPAPPLPPSRFAKEKTEALRNQESWLGAGWPVWAQRPRSGIGMGEVHNYTRLLKTARKDSEGWRTWRLPHVASPHAALPTGRVPRAVKILTQAVHTSPEVITGHVQTPGSSRESTTVQVSHKCSEGLFLPTGPQRSAHPSQATLPLRPLLLQHNTSTAQVVQVYVCV
jgi:hypothetical protein